MKGWWRGRGPRFRHGTIRFPGQFARPEQCVEWRGGCPGVGRLSRSRYSVMIVRRCARSGADFCGVRDGQSPLYVEPLILVESGWVKCRPRGGGGGVERLGAPTAVVGEGRRDRTVARGLGLRRSSQVAYTGVWHRSSVLGP